MILKRRRKNEGIDREREMEIKDYWQKKNGSCRMNSLDDLPLFSDYCDAHRKTPSRFVAKRMEANVKTRSNGESAFQYFTGNNREPIAFICLMSRKTVLPRAPDRTGPLSGAIRSLQ